MKPEKKMLDHGLMVLTFHHKIFSLFKRDNLDHDLKSSEVILEIKKIIIEKKDQIILLDIVRIRIDMYS